MYQVRIEVTFHSGHRLLNYQGKCAYPHGHTYKAEIFVASTTIDELGMVADFSQLKDGIRGWLEENWDHAFLVWRGDTVVANFLAGMPEPKTVVLDAVPTAENLARIAFSILDPLYRDSYGNHLHLERIRLYETPNCWADANRDDLA